MAISVRKFMSIERQHVCTLVLYYVGYTKVRNLAFRLRGETLTRFVTFHDIPASVAGHFRRNILWLRKNANVISLDDYFAKRLSPKKVNVVLTFDDGYKSWVSTAVPLLKQLRMPATFFVSSGLLDLSPEEEADFIRNKLRTNLKTTGALKRDDVQRIVEHGFTVGGHTSNHVNLSEMRDKMEIRREILTDKQNLESASRRAINYFAYPFGEYCNPVADLTVILREVGYKGAVTLVPGFNRNGANCYCLRREITGLPMSLGVFKARVFGAYDGVNSVRKLLGLTSYQML